LSLVEREDCIYVDVPRQELGNSQMWVMIVV